MSKPSALLRASVAAVGAALAATAAALDPLEFVAGWPIEAPAGAEIFDVPLTADVYAAAQSIQQIAVLDANGEPQPFFLSGPPSNAPTERRVVLEASPLYAGNPTAAPSVGVTTGAGGTSVSVTPGSAGSVAITGFVLDARAVDSAPFALELDWRALPQPFLLDVAVEQSTDLTSWRSVGRASVAAPRRRRLRARAGTTGSPRAAVSPTGTCCARLSSARLARPRRRRAFACRRRAAASRPRILPSTLFISTRAVSCRCSP